MASIVIAGQILGDELSTPRLFIRHPSIIAFLIVGGFMILDSVFGLKFRPLLVIGCILAWSVIYGCISAFTPQAVAGDIDLQEVEIDPNKPVESIEKQLKQFCKTYGLPGMVAGYQRADGPMVLGSYGVRKKGDDAKITSADKIHLGSCTKAMTATMIARLVERGSLALGYDDWGGIAGAKQIVSRFLSRCHAQAAIDASRRYRC